MTRRRVWWTVAVVLTLVLWAAVLVIPAAVLLLPNQWQGTSVEVPPEILVRQLLYAVSPPLVTAALVMTTALVVLVIAGRRPAPQRASGVADDLDGVLTEGVLLEQERGPRR